MISTEFVAAGENLYAVHPETKELHLFGHVKTIAPPRPERETNIVSSGYCVDHGHTMSGWTRIPTTRLDFRRCTECGHLEVQERPNCALCHAMDTRAIEIPEYGLAYLCQPCIDDAGATP